MEVAVAALGEAETSADVAEPVSTKQSVRQRKRKKLENAFRDYFDFSETLAKLPPHRVLAINRGEKAKILRVRVEVDSDSVIQVAARGLLADEHPQADFLFACLQDALVRLVVPSLEREIRRELTDRAEAHAVDVFARNLRSLLLQAPVRNRRVLAIDPGFRSGCKLMALDEFGCVLGHAVVHLVGTDQRRQQAIDKIANLVKEFSLTAIVIGNGTACRETEQLVADAISGPLESHDVSYAIVNEAGASVYSTSPLGREELPDIDAMLRSAVSIGRRLLDPLSELVKINPANIGVGLYQHDVKSKHLRASLDAVVESCVNYVGVDVNTASPALLGYVSGLNQLTARRLYEHRQQHGPFQTREQFKDVSGFGEATFVQSAGFLRIAAAENQLDGTWIHPESYPIAHQILARLGNLNGEAAEDGQHESAGASWEELLIRSDALDLPGLASELSTSDVLLQDILTALATKGRDPREDLPQPVFRRGIRKLEDLENGMELVGTVLNVVDFGVFVDIGLNDSGLIHISRLSNRFIRDPHDVVSVGDTIRTWVIDIDKKRRRVSLTAIEPGTEQERRGPQKKSSDSARRRPKQPRSRPPAKHKTHQAQGNRPPRPKRPPKPAKPVKPITEEMVDGKEPMRSFSDLMQFYEKKTDDD